MEQLINHMANEFNRKIIYNYYGNEIKVYYRKTNIIYLKNQYNLLIADKRVSFTLLCRKMGNYYKKELYYLYKHWRYYNRCYDNNKDNYKLNLVIFDYLYVVNIKNVTIMTITYYDTYNSLWK